MPRNANGSDVNDELQRPLRSTAQHMTGGQNLSQIDRGTRSFIMYGRSACGPSNENLVAAALASIQSRRARRCPAKRHFLLLTHGQ